MFEKLKQKWKVGPLQLVLILLTFALGGSACGYLGKMVMQWLPIENRTAWILVYILLVTLLWPLCVLIVSVPLGQFGFFRTYVSKIIGKLRFKK